MVVAAPLYTLGLRESINNSNVILAEAERERVEIVGREAVWSNWHSRSTATGTRGEGAALPVPDAQKFVDPRESVRYAYHTIKVTGPSIELSRNDKGAFLRAIDSEMRGAEKDLKNDIARQLFGQATAQTSSASVARTGAVNLLAENTSVGGATQVQLHADTTRAEMRYFFVGMRLTFITTLTGATVSNGANRRVTAIDVPNRRINVDGSANITTVDGDQVVRADANGNSYDTDVFGLRALINDAAGDEVVSGTQLKIHNVSTDDVPTWAANVVGSSTTPISEDLLMEAQEVVETDGDGTTPKLFIGPHSQQRALNAELATLKRFVNKDAVTPTAGWKGLEIATDAVYVKERYCPDNVIFGISRDELAWAVGKDFAFDDYDGKVLFKALDGSDAYEARMKAYVNLVVTNRNSHVRINVQEV